MEINKEALGIWGAIFVVILSFVFAGYLDPGPEKYSVQYTIAEKMDGYVQHKYSTSPTYNLLLVDTDGKRSTVSVELLTYHDSKVGDTISFEYTKDHTPWLVKVLFFWFIVIFSVLFIVTVLV